MAETGNPAPAGSPYRFGRNVPRVRSCAFGRAQFAIVDATRAGRWPFV